MCNSTTLVASECRHPLKYEYNHCAGSPYPKHCPELDDSSEQTVPANDQAFCLDCWRQVKEKLTTEFYAERRRITAAARAQGAWTDEEISQMREELRDQYYDRLKLGNRPRPSAPQDEGQTSGTSAAGSSSLEVDVNDEASNIRAQLKEWTYRKLDYVFKPLPVEPVSPNLKHLESLWLQRNATGMQLEYVEAPRYGGFQESKTGIRQAEKAWRWRVPRYHGKHNGIEVSAFSISSDTVLPMMGKQPNLYAFGDVDNLAKSLRKYVLQCQSTGLDRHAVFKVALSGGSLPKILAKALLPQTQDDFNVDFSKWEIFFADERAVPLDHEDSNYGLLKNELLDKIPAELGRPNVHPIDVQYLDDVQEMADQYQDSLMKSFAAKDSVKLPIFDLLLLGCGPDGHTCSLFPNHELLRESDAWVAPIEDSPKPPAKRITLTLPVVTHGTKIAFVATGEGKKEIMKQILDTEEGRSLPCGLVNEGGADRVSWFTDHGAVQGVGFPRRGSL